MQRPHTAYRNQLLRALERDDLKALEPHLEPVHFDYEYMAQRKDRLIQHIFFPEDGLLSVVCSAQNGRTIDVGLIGREGMTGLPIVMGATQALRETRVRVPSAGHRIEAVRLAGLLQVRGSLQRDLLRYAHVFNEQVAQTVLATGGAKIEVRLARWLLMAADRIGGDGMPITHGLLAEALCVHRPGVTDALHRLEGELMIKAQRSSLTIRDRAALEAMAGGFYGSPEQEYQRMFGSLPAVVEQATSTRRVLVSASDGSGDSRSRTVPL